jgi:hypothetical protein
LNQRPLACELGIYGNSGVSDCRSLQAIRRPVCRRYVRAVRGFCALLGSRIGGAARSGRPVILHRDMDDPGVVRSTLLVLHEAEIHLRQRAEQRIRYALQIGTLQLAGYNGPEIRERSAWASTSSGRPARGWPTRSRRRARTHRRPAIPDGQYCWRPRQREGPRPGHPARPRTPRAPWGRDGAR